MINPPSITKARMKLHRLVREVESGKQVYLTRRGKCVVVMIGTGEYERLTARPARFSEAWDNFRREVALQELDINPSAVFANTRGGGSGRNADL